MRFTIVTFLIVFLCIQTGAVHAFSEETTTVCKTVADQIGPDRNNFSGGVDLSEGYLHNFDIPLGNSTCGTDEVIEATVSIEINSVDDSAVPSECSFFNLFGNILVESGPIPFTPGCCGIDHDFLSAPICTGFGSGTSTPGIYSADLVSDCSNSNLVPGGVIGVDIIAAMDFSQSSCLSNGSAISDGLVIVDYEICVTITILSPEEPIVDAGPDVTIGCGESATIGGDPVGYDSETLTFKDGWTYEWSDGQLGNFGFGDNGQVMVVPPNPNDPTSYIVTVVGDGGCEGTDEVVVTIIPDITCNADPCVGDIEIVDPADPCSCIVDEVQVLGCTDPLSCNYDPAANCDDGSCMPFPNCNMDICAGDLEELDPADPCQCTTTTIQVLGCTDPTSCNYDPAANCDDGSCMPVPTCNADPCVGDVEIIDPADPCSCIIDEVQVLGCTDPLSCNYDPAANCDDGSCMPFPNCNMDICAGDIEILDPDDPCNCIVDIPQVLGCMDPTACNYDPTANCDDGSCMSTPICNTDICAGDTEIIDPADPCACIVDVVQVLGCTDPSSDNYDPAANCDDGSCDCIPDGCTDPAACNYDPAATCDDGSCMSAPICNTDICAGDTEIIDPADPCSCIVDEVQVLGCTNPNASNYDPAANCDDGSCDCVPDGCTDPMACNYDPNATCDDGSCLPVPSCNTDPCLGDIEVIDPIDPCNCIIDEVQVLGCTDPMACNYNPSANCDDGSCLTTPMCNTDICLGDTEIVDPNDPCNCILDEIQVLGCTNPNASNYNPDANCDDGSCDCVPDGCTDPMACNYDPNATCDDGSCLPMPICNTDPCIGDIEILDPNDPCNCIVDEVQVLGCTDPMSCNYDPAANCDDGSCLPMPICNTDPCIGDIEILDPNDPCNCIVDEVQVLGCTDPMSCNYDPAANCDDGSCLPMPICNTDPCVGDIEILDPNDPCNCIVDEVQVLGCTDPMSCNYDPAANCDDGSCLPMPICNTDPCVGDIEIIDPNDPCNCIVDEVQVLGCTDPTATNYNPAANCDDGSCEYDCLAIAEAGIDAIFPCAGVTLTLNGSGSSVGAEYSYVWTTLDGELLSGVDELTPTIGSAGTYILTVINTDQMCEVSDTVIITDGMNDITGADFDLQTPECFGVGVAAISINQVFGGSGSYSYELIPGGETNLDGVFTLLEEDDYIVVITDSEGCEFIVDFSIDFPEDINLESSSLDFTIEAGDSTEVELITDLDETEINSISWTPADGTQCQDCLSQYLSPEETTNYTVILTDTQGCMDTVMFLVNVIENTDVFIGNIFNPSSTGSNSLFVQSGDNVSLIDEFLIFDRWGNEVFRNENFQTNDPSEGWDGTIAGQDAVQGVYVYMVSYTLLDGQVIQKYSDVTLIR